MPHDDTSATYLTRTLASRHESLDAIRVSLEAAFQFIEAFPPCADLDPHVRAAVTTYVDEARLKVLYAQAALDDALAVLAAPLAPTGR